MADNYLERKMEELRRGVSGVSASPRRIPAGKGLLCFQFPPKRVLIISIHPSCVKVARAYLKAGSKVAMMHSDVETGTAMARNEGIRYIHIPDNSISCPDAEGNGFKEVDEALLNLLKAWRDLDIVIADARYASVIASVWADWRSRYPHLSDYISRLIIIGDSQSSLASIPKTTVNAILPSSPAIDITDLILSLTLPANHILNHQFFKL